MTSEPDSSAVRTALWRALHVQVDPPPHLLNDEIGLQLAAPAPGWQERGDMHPVGTAPYRIAIVARTRFVEDLLTGEGIGQYVLLGAGLDTFAQRHGELADRVEVFEIDEPDPQAWKRRRLDELGFGIPSNLHLVPVDFEAGDDFRAALDASGFDATAPSLVYSSGVSMYLSIGATATTLRSLASLAPGSIVVMTYMVPIDLADPADRAGLEGAARGAQASGTPWVSFYRPAEIEAMASDAGFAGVRTVSTRDLTDRYLAGRGDGLRAASGEEILLART